jgi:hypothetical protein
MELPSPVASLILSPALKSVVTFGGHVWFAAIPIRRVPVLRDSGPDCPPERVSDGAKEEAGG